VVLLNNIVVPNLPSPYYHFEYNADNTISSVSFASGFLRYTVTYSSGRIVEMINDVQGAEEKLKYFYDIEGRVMAVNYLDVTGAVYIKIFFFAGRKLIKLERQRRLGSNFFMNKIMSFSYYPDGNLKKLIDYRPAVDGRQPESTTVDRFDQYDNGINVDGFSLIHNEFFDHVILLPGVQFQKSNPTKKTFISDELSYRLDFTYTYNNKNLPLTREGKLVMTGGGASTGQTFRTNSSYSYY
jgi:hypothetical protein